MKESSGFIGFVEELVNWFLFIFFLLILFACIGLVAKAMVKTFLFGWRLF